MMAATPTDFVRRPGLNAAIARRIDALGGANTGPQITALGWWRK